MRGPWPGAAAIGFVDRHTLFASIRLTVRSKDRQEKTRIIVAPN